MSQAYSAIFRKLGILKHICPYSSIFWEIQAYSESWHSYSVRNSPRQPANAEAFAEACLHYIVFASAIKMPRQLNSQKLFKKIVFLELKNKFFVKEKKIFFIIKPFLQGTNYSCASIFIMHTFISYIFNSLLYLLCYALNEVIDVIHFFLSKQIFLLLKSLCYALN